jgi:hypothetical protein
MKSINKLNKRAEVIFNKLTQDLTKLGDHHKWDNAPGAFMAACIEIIDETKAGKIVSIAHYWLHESGDMMRDPDVCLLASNGLFAEVGVIPLSFRQDGLGIDSQAAVVQEDGRIAYSPRKQLDLTRFCNQFLVNISQQQF